MDRRAMIAGSAAALLTWPSAASAQDAAPVDPRVPVIEVIGNWYRALRERDDRALYALIGPMAIVQQELTRCRTPQSRACDLVFAPDLLAFKGLRFTTEIRQLEVQDTLARASVLVRAWFPSQQGDYQRAAMDEFYLRRWPDRGWLVAVAGEQTIAVP